MGIDKDEQAALSLAQAVMRFKETQPARLELAALEAQVTFERYSSLIKAGFNESQALYLCIGVKHT